jgi:hypothetical protein
MERFVFTQPYEYFEVRSRLDAAGDAHQVDDVVAFAPGVMMYHVITEDTCGEIREFSRKRRDELVASGILRRVYVQKLD